MKNLKNDRLIKALQRQPVDRTPVWLMRQAGRYLPEYRKLRACTPNFVQFCMTPELAMQATLQPLARFPLDAAIIFSDILTIPHAMGMDLEFIENRGPVIHNPIRTIKDVKQLRLLEVTDSLGYVMEAISLTVKELDAKVPLIGFAGSPWTIASYMIEGNSSRSFSIIKAMLYSAPEILLSLLGKLSEVIADYLNAQIQAGADAVMIFDTWGGALAYQEYQDFSLKYMQKIVARLQREVDGNRIPVILFTKNSGQWLETIAASGCDAVGLDSSIDIRHAKAIIGDKVALQGNLDPFLLFASSTQIESEVKKILDSYGREPGHVFNLGHGIDKNTPISGVEALFAAIEKHGIKS